MPARIRIASTLLLSIVPCASVAAAAPVAEPELEEVVVIAPYGLSLARDRIPARAQTADAQRIQALQPLDLSDLLNRGFGSVSINQAQNNPLQPDLNFRGFTASPLLGLPQGISVYANGVRMNETFGDTVNWDLLPITAIHSVQLLAGPSPVFGLNTLGGALSIQLKNGFNYDRSSAELYAGSFGRRSASVQHGGNNGSWGYYGNVDYFAEDGWRDFSASQALRFQGAASHRAADSSFDLTVNHADSKLRGNGAAPVELLALDRSQVFTHPDITDNKLTQIIAEGTRELPGAWKASGNAFYRDLATDTFNGDGTIFEQCAFAGLQLLVESGFTDLNEDGLCTAADDTGIVPVLDQAGDPVNAVPDGEELNAINNIGRRQQHSHGASLQFSRSNELPGGMRNDFLVGAAYSRGATGFDAEIELARLEADRSTAGTGVFAGEFSTAVDSAVTNWSLYAADTIDVVEALSLTLAGRVDHSRIRLADRSGQSPELNGRHQFGRFNPAAGLTYRARPDLLFYASLSQGSRTPTAVELACADEDAPCSLPNAFLADPPLDEVVARNFELGLRGRTSNSLAWHIGAFHTINRNDILFQTTGGAQANIGFFANVSDTRRSGFELELSQHLGRIGWTLDYSLIDASFRDEFIVNSPNHPLFRAGSDSLDGADRIRGAGKLLVTPGSTIPGIARHQANLTLDLRATDGLRLGADLAWRSGVYLRGDEINVLGRTTAYAVLNLRGELRVNDGLTVFARIENVLDADYETFGLLGEPDEVFAGFEDPRFYSAGPPRGAWLGVRVSL